MSEVRSKAPGYLGTHMLEGSLSSPQQALSLNLDSSTPHLRQVASPHPKVKMRSLRDLTPGRQLLQVWASGSLVGLKRGVAKGVCVVRGRGRCSLCHAHQWKGGPLGG